MPDAKPNPEHPAVRRSEQGIVNRQFMPLPTFDNGTAGEASVGVILRQMDDAAQLRIAALDYSERAQLLIHVQAWCDRFTAYHAEGRRTHSAAG